MKNKLVMSICFLIAYTNAVKVKIENGDKQEQGNKMKMKKPVGDSIFA